MESAQGIMCAESLQLLHLFLKLCLMLYPLVFISFLREIILEYWVWLYMAFFDFCVLIFSI